MILAKSNHTATKNLIIYSTSIKKNWTHDKVKNLVDELKKAKNKAIDNAVKKAVIPLIAENKILKIEIKKQKEIINKKNISNILIFISGLAATFFIGFFVGVNK